MHLLVIHKIDLITWLRDFKILLPIVLRVCVFSIPLPVFWPFVMRFLAHILRKLHYVSHLWLYDLKTATGWYKTPNNEIWAFCNFVIARQHSRLCVSVAELCRARFCYSNCSSVCPSVTHWYAVRTTEPSYEIKLRGSVCTLVCSSQRTS